MDIENESRLVAVARADRSDSGRKYWHFQVLDLAVLGSWGERLRSEVRYSSGEMGSVIDACSRAVLSPTLAAPLARANTHTHDSDHPRPRPRNP